MPLSTTHSAWLAPQRLLGRLFFLVIMREIKNNKYHRMTHQQSRP
uniref:AlNc14C48G3834 protein n=1 Tax=Albugo laibachii Nc14 TaxID=890382 RepID=F0WAX3_9STRA|nr:AlNc14C48G3834 [Albugo laibachii Nc14]|eukprot:CCA18295.1 AlNc14C48G3834 [Albugo laibachii Nc14]